MENYKKLSQYDIRTVLSMTDLFPTIVDNGDGTFSNKTVPLSAIRAYQAVPVGGTTSQVLQKNTNTDYDTQWHTLAKGDVGLSNVDNTSDVNKPVSTATQAAIDSAVDATKQALYPVGSIYTNASNATNPATLLGFGTWTAFGASRVLVGKDTTGTFSTIGATGGSETVTLTEAQMPAHNHYTQMWKSVSEAGGYGLVGSSSFQDRPIVMTSGAGIYTETRGSSNAHNNRQPYIVVYMWQRTA